MSHTKLREFFKEKTRRAKPVGVDWIAKRDAWIFSVHELYAKIEKYLKGTGVELKRRDKPVWENFIGDYCIPELLLKSGNENVLFSPKGANVIGAQNRVDVFGDRGDATLIWQSAHHWCIVASRVPKLQLVPLTADSLADMLSSIMLP